MNQADEEAKRERTAADRPPGTDPGLHPRGDAGAELSAQRPRDRGGGGTLVELYRPQPPEPARAAWAHPARPEQVTHRAAGRGGRPRGEAAKRDRGPTGGARRGGGADPRGAEHRGPRDALRRVRPGGLVRAPNTKR